jgi:glycerol-3-phosphate acyltransferase PlsY
MVVTALYSDGSSKTLTSGYSVKEFSSQKEGTCKVYVTYGKKAAALTLLGDMLKAVAAALIGYALLGMCGAYVAGLFCVIGHMFPVYYGFRGGKGVATLSATIFLVSWRYGIVAAAVAAATLLLSGYLSIAAVVAAAAFALLLLLRANIELALVGCAVFALALCGQWTNLWGIRDGTATRDLSSRR